MVTRVIKMSDVYKPDKDANNRNDLGKLISKVIELALQRRLFLFLIILGNTRVDGTDGGSATGKDNKGLGGTIDNSSAGEKDIGHVLLNSRVVLDHSVRLANRHRFTSEHGLVDSERGRGKGENSTISGDPVTNVNRNNVARDERRGRDPRKTAVTENQGFIRRVFFQSLMGCNFSSDHHKREIFLRR